MSISNRSINKSMREPIGTSYIFQIGWMLVTSLIVCYLIYTRSQKFQSQDLEPPLHSFTPEQIVQFRGNAYTVKIGLFISDFPKFDVANNDFIFNGILFFQFDPGFLSLESLEKFSFSKGTILYKSEPTTYLRNGLLFALYSIRVQFKTNLNFTYFPFEDHKISFSVDHELLSPAEVFFEPSVARFTIKEEMYTLEWQQYNKYVNSGYIVNQLESFNPDSKIYHTRINFVIEYLRRGVRSIISILFPLFILLFVSLFSLAMDTKKYASSVIGLLIGSIAGMVSYKFVIERLTPNVGYFVLSDFIYFLFLAFIIIIFLCHSQVIEIGIKFKKFLTILIHLIVIFVFIYFLKF